VVLTAVAVWSRRQVVAFTRSRRARFGTNALLMIVFFTAILVVVQAISVRNDRRFDFTGNQRFTLAEQTTEVIAGLTVDVVMTAFFRRGTAEEQRAKELLELYAGRSDRLAFEIVDPDRRPHVADDMGASYDEIVVTSGDRRRVVDQVTEEGLTNALVQVTRPRLKTILFVTGHDERDIQSFDRIGYGAVREGLTDQGYVVQVLSLLDVAEVTDDCEVLVVADPYDDYLEDETRRIDAYLRRGGSALFLIEPRRNLPKVEALLREHGIALPPAEILEEVTVRDSDRQFGPRWTKVLRYQSHPITDGFRAATFYHSARPVQIVADESDLRYRTAYLAISSESAWGETDETSFKKGAAERDGEDIAGPLPVAAAVTRSYTNTPGDDAPQSRFVVFGDADFVANANYGLLGNSDIFHNAVAFLAGDEDLISIRPRERTRDQIYITASQGRLIFALCIVLLPLSVVGVGTTVFVKRRNR
jgi:ABC-type uncharacterized transport system involved in gliding motility auxiliary subunit